MTTGKTMALTRRTFVGKSNGLYSVEVNSLYAQLLEFYHKWVLSFVKNFLHLLRWSYGFYSVFWISFGAPYCQWVSSVVQSGPPLCDPMNHSMPGLPVHHQLPGLPKLMSIEWVMPSNHLILCHPLLLPSSIFPSIWVFSNESVLRIRWPNCWSFSFSISPSMNTQDWCPLGWTGWISLQSKGLSRVFSSTTFQNHYFFSAQLSL